MTRLSFECPMGVPEIERCIPHRFPFLLVDKVLSYEPGVSIRAIKNVSIGDPVLQGHFPGNPVMPGVYMVEAMAQASAVLGKLSTEASDTCLLMEINDTRFRRIVRPGDTLELKIDVLKQRGSFFWFKGEASVDGELAASANFSAKLS